MAASMEMLYSVRRAKNIAAQVLATAATIFGLFWLAWIVWTTLKNGISALDLDLFTKMTPPPGDDGGMLNAIFGLIAMSLLGILFGAPIGVLAGTYLAEFAQTRWTAKLAPEAPMRSLRQQPPTPSARNRRRVSSSRWLRFGAEKRCHSRRACRPNSE